jgi:hypothetical protein
MLFREQRAIEGLGRGVPACAAAPLASALGPEGI